MTAASPRRANRPYRVMSRIPYESLHATYRTDWGTLRCHQSAASGSAELSMFPFSTAAACLTSTRLEATPINDVRPAHPSGARPPTRASPVRGARRAPRERSDHDIEVALIYSLRPRPGPATAGALGGRSRSGKEWAVGPMRNGSAPPSKASRLPDECLGVLPDRCSVE